MSAAARKFDPSELASTVPSYRSIAWIERLDGRLAFVTIDRDEDNLGAWDGREVIIDGVRHQCVRLLTYQAGPVCEGDTVGLLVSNGAANPAIDQSI